MDIESIFYTSAAIITSLGGSAVILAAFSHWLGKIWATRMLESERAKHSEILEKLKAEVDSIKQKELTRHFDKLAIYKDVIHIICELLRELEVISISKKGEINTEIENSFALNRHKAYGYLSLVSNQHVMDKYNDMIDFFLEIIYDNKTSTWKEMRSKADALLNAMRTDLGIKEGDVHYKGSR